MGAVTRGGYDAGTKLIFDAILGAAAERATSPPRLLERNFLANEATAAQSMAQLELDGTPLYEIEPALLEALENSDIGDMRLADLRTPNRTYFLHWGPQPGLLLHGKHPVEGALVFSFHPDWRVCLVARTPHSWLLPPERDTFSLRFPAETLSLPFEQAVDLAIQRDKEGLVAAMGGVQAQARAPGGARAEALALATAELDLNTPVLKEALALVGSCIAYLTAYPADSRFDWEADTPKSLLAKMARGGKEQMNTASRLRSMGFIQVHQVGLDFRRSVEQAGTTGQEGQAGVRPHWRRGHWRHQAYGEHHALRKLIWLRPTRVLGGPALPP